MDISQKGIEFIQSFEKFCSTPYRCQAGKLTIGYGHVILPTDKFKSITEDDAQNLFKRDLKDKLYIVNTNVCAPLDQCQFDALVSFVFNNKVASFLKSTLLKVLNQKKYKEAGLEFLKWRFYTDPKTGVKKESNGLLARRTKESLMFMTGIYENHD